VRLSKVVGKRIKEDPKDAQTISHKLLVRGGYIRPVSAGIYSLLPMAKKVITKIEAIIRQEMNRVEGQEVLLPVVLPAELWEESGRYKTVGAELLRFKDRNNKEMLLGMTHEEAVVHLFRTEVTSYKQLPAMLYQIQTKYRDEARPRAGLIRVREFTMKDAYSFHETQDDLEQYYERVHEAYERIFKRIGMNNVISIKANSGMMGGSVSHEFMAVADCGEDTLFLSPDRQYKANREIAVSSIKFDSTEEQLELEKVHTPNKESIEDVSSFLGLKPENTGKAVFYSTESDDLVFVMIRGDFEVNETKLKNHLQVNELSFATDEQIKAIGAEPGFASPLGVDFDSVKVVVDPSVVGSTNLVVGANEKDYHFKNFNFKRDLDKGDVVDIATVRAGDPCPMTGQPLEEKRGVEVGNIFQLGTKYTKSMGCTYLDRNGKSQVPIMGCYGIGVGRSMAAIIEGSHDKWGPIWPITVAPFDIQICALNIKKSEVLEASEKLYSELLDNNLDVLYDDRGEKPGAMFSDADLIGVPFRIVVSPKTIANNEVELKKRGDKDGQLLKVEDVLSTVKQLINDEYEKYN
jgi:prolyl-tRNA synthetase